MVIDISKAYCGLSLSTSEKRKKTEYLDKAVKWLLKADKYQDGDLLMLAVDPAYEPLHDNATYQQILRARNLHKLR